MIITIRLNELDGTLLKLFARDREETVSGYIKRVVFDDIESEYNRLIETSCCQIDGESTADY